MGDAATAEQYELLSQAYLDFKGDSHACKLVLKLKHMFSVVPDYLGLAPSCRADLCIPAAVVQHSMCSKPGQRQQQVPAGKPHREAAETRNLRVSTHSSSCLLHRAGWTPSATLLKCAASAC